MISAARGAAILTALMLVACASEPMESESESQDLGVAVDFECYGEILSRLHDLGEEASASASEDTSLEARGRPQSLARLLMRCSVE